MAEERKEDTEKHEEDKMRKDKMKENKSKDLKQREDKSTSDKREDKIEGTMSETVRYSLDRMTQLLLLIVFLGGAAFLLIVLFFTYPKVTHPSPIFFKMTDVSQLFPEPPLDKPNLATNELLNWLVQSIMTANTFNFITFAKNIDSAQSFFTPEGYTDFKNFLTQSKLLDTVISEKLVFTAVATAAPQIVAERALAGRYFWKINFPMEFDFRSVTVFQNTPVDVSVLVMRVPATQSAFGILIYKYEVKAKGGGTPNFSPPPPPGGLRAVPAEVAPGAAPAAGASPAPEGTP